MSMDWISLSRERAIGDGGAAIAIARPAGRA
jgi:hypothetical protein